MKRNTVIRGIQACIAVAIVVFLISTTSYQTIFSLLTTLDIRLIILAGACYFLNNGLMACRIKKLLFVLGENIRFRLVFFSHMAGMLLSDFTPARSGYLYTALALNKHDIPTEKGISTITSTYLYDLAFKMIVAVIGAYFIYSSAFSEYLVYAMMMTTVLVFGILGGCIIILYPGEQIKKFLKKWKLTGKLLHLGEQTRAIQKHAGFILSITIAGWVLRGLQWYLIALSTHQMLLKPIDALFLNPLLTLLSFVPLTPAGWGLQEAGIVFVFVTLGVGATVATSFALITRFIEAGIDIVGIKDITAKPLSEEDLFTFYNTIPGDIDEKAYNSDMLVQQYFQRRKTESIKNALDMKNRDLLLDIGCGSGVQIQAITENGYIRAIGIDVNQNAVQFARTKNIPNTEFIVADAQHLPIKSDSVDKIVCAEIIEHLAAPRYLIDEVTRVLKHDGTVVITTPNDRSVWGIYEFFWDVLGRGRNYGNTHLRFFSQSNLRGIFSGFSECKTQSLFFISPVFALFNNHRLLQVGKKIDVLFENVGLGVSILLCARK